MKKNNGPTNHGLPYMHTLYISLYNKYYIHDYIHKCITVPSY